MFLFVYLCYMKIKIKQTTTQEVEISLPYYSKGLTCFCKVISEDMGIQVSIGNYIKGISKGSPFVILAFDSDQVECTEEEFNQAYEEMLHKLCE